MARFVLWASILLVSIAATTPADAASRRKGGKRHGARPVQKRVVLERLVAATHKGMPNVQAVGALVLDDEGRAVYARNADKERPIASISKLAAVLAVMDKGLELEGLSTINKGDVELAKGGARSRLLEGMTLSNRDLLHAALMGSDNRAIPALGRAVKMNPVQLTAAMNTKARQLGLKNTRFHEPTGLSTGNVSTPRETIMMLREVVAHPMLGPITRRAEYDAHPVGKPPIRYNNTDRPAARANVQVLGGKTGYNDDARYCLVIAARIDGHLYYMAFLGNEGKLTRFGDVARVADWVVSHPAKPPGPAKPASGDQEAVATGPTPGMGAPNGTSSGMPGTMAGTVTGSAAAAPPQLPIGVAAPTPETPASAATP